jgi:hypothetical protein
MISILNNNVSTKEKRKKTMGNPCYSKKKKIMLKSTKIMKNHEISRTTEAKIIKNKVNETISIAVVATFNDNKETRRKIKIG